MIILEKNRTELFIDDFIIEKTNGTVLRLHHPVSAGKVFDFDKAWEGDFCFYVTVFKDDNKYRMYYRGWPAVNNSENVHTCYAESSDGINWIKPSLGIVKIKGSGNNNILIAGENGTHAFGVFKDENPKAKESEKYKALGIVNKVNYGLGAYVSPDGINWKLLHPEPVLTKGAFDSLNVGFWSKHEQCYLAYYRTWTEATASSPYGGKRAISRSTSNDFVNWTEPETMNCGNTPIEEFYTNGTHPYFRAPHIYIAIPKRFCPQKRVITDEEATRLKVDPSQIQGISDSVLLTSRGGNRYDRTFMEAFIRPGPDIGNWSARNNYTATGVVPTGYDEMSLYVIRHYAQPTIFLERMTLRTDGFASLYADYFGGEMITKPLIINGNEIVLNTATSAAGTVQLEIMENEKPINGFSLQDCIPMTGDKIEYPVRWKSGKSIGELVNRPVKIRFVLNDADIYSLTIK